MLGLQAATVVLTGGTALELYAGGYWWLGSVQALSAIGQVADVAVQLQIKDNEVPEIASYINYFNICNGIVDFANIGRTANALSQTTALATQLKTVNSTLKEPAEKFVIAIETAIKARQRIDAKADKLYRWLKVQSLNLTRSPDGKLFADIFGIGGLYYPIFNTNSKLLLKLQSIEDLSKVKAFFEKIGPRGLNLSADAKLALQADLLSSDDLLKGLVDDVDLVDVWNEIRYLINERGDIEFLTWVKKFDRSTPQGSNLYDHIFVGKTGGTNGISGVHHKNALTTKTSGFSSGDIRIKSGTKTPKGDGFYEAEIEYFDGTNWITKTEDGLPVKNGFFPDAWDSDKIMEEIANARAKITTRDWVVPIPPKTKSNTFEGTLSNGQKVCFYIGSQTTTSSPNMPNYITSVFPKF